MNPQPGPQCQHPGCGRHVDVRISFAYGVRCAAHRPKP